MSDDVIERTAARALARARRGQSLNEAEVTALLCVDGDQRRELMGTAARLRDLGLAAAGRPGVITYSPKVFIPLTRLCRDRCRYCTFATSPARLRQEGSGLFLEPDEVLDIARAGVAAGCTEALFTLGDRPEDRWSQAGEWLADRGHPSTVSYLREVARRVLDETGLLPHLNPGVLSWEELARLRPTAASMGLMLESSAERLFSDPGGPHFRSPDKDPRLRLRTIADAGRQSIPFTTGVLVGIGETAAELATSLIDLQQLSLRFGHIQEVIVQNFRAKEGTAMAGTPDASTHRHLNAVAVARLVLGPDVSIQAPPNLVDGDEQAALLAAGIGDWGGISPVTIDHVNPERPWPDLDLLAERTGDAGYRLSPRLAVYPEYLRDPDQWIAGPVQPAVSRLAGRSEVSMGVMSQDAADRARPSPVRLPAGGGLVGSTGSHAALAGDALERGFRLAELDPAALSDPRNEDPATALMAADGQALERLVELADRRRRERVGDEVTFVVNRNINFTNICYTGCRFCAFARRADDRGASTLTLDEIGRRVAEAVSAGATEICMQGGIHPHFKGDDYLELIRVVKQAAPGVHLHAFSPMEVHVGAVREGLPVGAWLDRLRDAGLDSMPGTAAEILVDEVRWELTRGKLPTAAWVEVVKAAHRAGIPTSSTMMYGHVDHPGHWVRHLAVLRRLQEETAGITEFVGLPFVHRNTPLYLSGQSRPGPSSRDDTAVTAMARVMLDEVIPNVQVSWVKLGPDRCAELLAAGANDLGGTLLEEAISLTAGATHGTSMGVGQLCSVAERAHRPWRERDTLYRSVAGQDDRRSLPVE